MICNSFGVFCQRKVFCSDLWRAISVDKSLNMIVFHLFGQIVDIVFYDIGAAQSLSVKVVICGADFIIKIDDKAFHRANFLNGFFRK